MTASEDVKIDRAVQALQSLPPVARALLGREQLILRRVLGREIGPREQRLMGLLSWSGQPGMLLISLFLYSGGPGSNAAYRHACPYRGLCSWVSALCMKTIYVRICAIA